MTTKTTESLNMRGEKRRTAKGEIGEAAEQGEKKRIMKKKKRRHQQENKFFPLLLSASLREPHNNKALIKKCLNKIYLSLPHSLSTPILSLLPAMLKSGVADIACKSAEIIGAASLISFEMNGKIAADDEIMKTLISLLGSSVREIAAAACNAVLDLSTASVGRLRLLEFSAIDYILLCFIQAPKTSAPITSVAADTILLREDEYPVLLLQGATSLINSCTIDMLQHLPLKLSDAFLLYLKGLWREAHKQKFCRMSTVCNKEKYFYSSEIKINDLAESIFRLSIHYCPYPGATALDILTERIFALSDISLEKFLSTIWELSPMLLRDGSKASKCQDDIFSPFIRHLGSKEAIPTHLPSILKCFIACPPLDSDEFDIVHFIGETRNLCFPITYNQDIRVLKANYGEKESHYFRDRYVLHIDDIFRCKEALQEGYSIAVRGMEFRFPALAAIADGIASFFGQPSIGMNMYLTPPNSQGLAYHSDDHCVFVCQLIGSKKWTIYPRSDLQLPRLYESFDRSDDLEIDSQTTDGCKQILLKEGDVLYIPRGFPHEARTHVDDDEVNKTSGFSLHLTLAVEIEPPFEWEGFIHTAVYSMIEKQKSIVSSSCDFMQLNLNHLPVLLHVVIKLNADLDPTFRKACLVGSATMPSITGGWFYENQQTIFQYLIGKIANEMNFASAVRYVEAAVQKNEDPLEHVRWMKHLIVEGEMKTVYYSNTSPSDSKYFSDFLIKDRDTVEAAFMRVKSKFCDEVLFEDVEKHYKRLLEMYRKVRKQYINGMLSLHCTVDSEHDITS